MEIKYVSLLIVAVLISGCTATTQNQGSVNTEPEQIQPVHETIPQPEPGLGGVATVPPAIKEFTLEADDNGFYPSSTINVNSGDLVRITFTVRTTNVYYAGLQVRSSQFDTGKIVPGGSNTVEFTANQGFQFTSYWPSSGVVKSSGQVIVS